MAAPHLFEPRLQRTNASGGIEQRSALPTFFEPDSKSFTFRSVGGQSDCQGYEILPGVGDQFGHARRPQGACRNARGEMIAESGDDRDARPKHVAGRHVSGIDAGIERQVRQPRPGHVIGLRFPVCENQAGARDTALFRLRAQVELGERVFLQQPENAAIDATQNFAPCVEDIRRDLKALVEGAEDDCILR